MGKLNKAVEISVREEIKRQVLDNRMKVFKDVRIEQSILESWDTANVSIFVFLKHNH